MKPFLLINIVLFLLFTLVGCTQYNGDIGITEVALADIYEEANNEHENTGFGFFDQLVFPSIESFLSALRIIRSGGDITHLLASWSSFQGVENLDTSLTSVIERVNFSALERVYFPTNIPEEFEIYRITISTGNVCFWYLHREDLVSEKAILDARSQQRCFRFIFTFSQWDSESPMEYIIRRGSSVIDGEHFSINGPHSISWASDEDLLFMYTPHPAHNYERMGIDGRIARSANYGNLTDIAAELVKFTETEVINLLDESDISSRMRY